MDACDGILDEFVKDGRCGLSSSFDVAAFTRR